MLSMTARVSTRSCRSVWSSSFDGWVKLSGGGLVSSGDWRGRSVSALGECEGDLPELSLSSSDMGLDGWFCCRMRVMWKTRGSSGDLSDKVTDVFGAPCSAAFTLSMSRRLPKKWLIFSSIWPRLIRSPLRAGLSGKMPVISYPCEDRVTVIPRLWIWIEGSRVSVDL
jgi:hypothetical protein